MTIETHEASWLIGRLLLGGLFVVGGIRHLSAIPALTQAIAARGMPAAKIVLMPGTILQTVAGLALIAAAYTFWAACCRVVFSLAASVLLVNFWDMQDTAGENAVRTGQCNCATIGGLLIAAADLS